MTILFLKKTDFFQSNTLDNISKICSRKCGIGADGVIVSAGIDRYGIHSVNFFNSDATECGKSGNGLIIYAQWVKDQSLFFTDEIAVESKSGLSYIKKHYDNSYSVNLGIPSYETSVVGISDRNINCQFYRMSTPIGEISLASLFNGNSHTIVFTPVEKELRPIIVSHLNNSGLFKKGTNIQFITKLDGNVAVIDIWEHGAGNTSSSGASASAVAEAVVSRSLCKTPVTIQMDGGSMVIDIDSRGCVWQRAFPTQVFSGDLSIF